MNFSMGTDLVGAEIPLRIALGLIFIGHGCRKLFGWFGGDGFEQTVTEFKQLGMKPAPLMVLLAGAGQLVGGLLVLTGLWVTVGALLILFEVATGLFLVHLKHGFFLNWKNTPNQGHGVEYNLALVAMTLTLILSRFL